jgi:endonuclease III related protein
LTRAAAGLDWEELDRHLGAAAPDPGWPEDRWPVRGLFQPASLEIAVGAILTQNTRWTQVEPAMVRMSHAGISNPAQLAKVAPRKLEEAVRPAGFFRAKAATLIRAGELWTRLGERTPGRAELLEVKGIGPETADTILLYGFHVGRLIADSYLRRLLTRLGHLSPGLGYEPAARRLEPGTRLGVEFLQDFHARVIRFGREFCRKSPLCGPCPLRDRCPGRISGAPVG